MHAIEKIMAHHAGLETVKSGQIVTAKVDFAEINDLYLQTIYSFKEMGGTRVWDNTKCAFVFDHFAPTPDVQSAQNHKAMRAFAKANHLQHHFDVDSGVCHQVMPEAGLVYPGMLLIATDSHTTTHGAFGAMGTGVGATDMATILLTGELWLRVPEVIAVRLNGTAPLGVAPKDVILTILGTLHADGAVYQAIDFIGDYVDHLGVAGRMTICNMAVEAGAKTAYMQPNQAVLDYVAAHGVVDYHVETTDPDFQYAQTLTFDVSQMQPVIAFPGHVDDVRPVAAGTGVKVDQGYIGSCTGGRLADLEIAAKIVAGRHIPEYKRLLVVPASQAVLQAGIQAGYIQTLMAAGATVTAPGCGACLGVHQGILASGETCISSTNRNFPGRMGAVDADIYLASPATVAASIIAGQIVDPRAAILEAIK